MAKYKPHVLGIDDGPFEKGQPHKVPLVAVMLECPLLVEAVAMGALSVDADNVTDYLANWIADLRCFPSLQAILLGGITMVGLGIVDISSLAHRLSLPVLKINRRKPNDASLAAALTSAGLEDRLDILARTPATIRVREGLYLAYAGSERAEAERILIASLGEAQIPEALRLAHLIARARVMGESRGRA